MRKELEFTNFLNRLTDYNEYYNKIILQFMGLTLTNTDCSKINTNWSKINSTVFLIGDRGIGKNTLKDFITALVGEKNHTTFDSTYIDKCGVETARLFNKRFATSVDTDYRDSFDFSKPSVLSDIVNGETIEGKRRKSGNPFHFAYTGTILFIGTKMPKIIGGSEKITILDLKSKPIPRDEMINTLKLPPVNQFIEAIDDDKK